MGRVTTLLEYEKGGCAVERAGIEMGKAEAFGEPTGERALPRSRRPVDRDNEGAMPHYASPIAAPSRFIIEMKSGKLVPIGAASSMRTAVRAPRPRTRNAIAMR